MRERRFLVFVCLVWLLVVSAMTYRNLFTLFFERLPGLIHKNWEKGER